MEKTDAKLDRIVTFQYAERGEEWCLVEYTIDQIMRDIVGPNNLQCPPVIKELRALQLLQVQFDRVLTEHKLGGGIVEEYHGEGEDFYRVVLRVKVRNPKSSG